MPEGCLIARSQLTAAGSVPLEAQESLPWRSETPGCSIFDTLVGLGSIPHERALNGGHTVRSPVTGNVLSIKKIQY